MHARADSAGRATLEVSYAAIPSGIRVPHVDAGSGEPLLFVHGSLCDYRYWSAQAGALSRDFRCIALSLSHYWPGGDAGAAPPSSWRATIRPWCGR